MSNQRGAGWKTKRPLLVAASLIHLFVVAAISARELFWIAAQTETLLPGAARPLFAKGEFAITAASGQALRPHNPLRQVSVGYLHAAGIESGYGYFGPNVPDGSKLVFELHFPDGRVGHEVPRVGSDASGLRVAAALDRLARMPSRELREAIVRMLANSVARRHPAVVRIRAIFGAVPLPTVAQFEQREEPSNRFLFAYDFNYGE